MNKMAVIEAAKLKRVDVLMLRYGESTLIKMKRNAGIDNILLLWLSPSVVFSLVILKAYLTL